MIRFIRGLFILVTVVTVVVYLVASLTPYISPVTFAPMTFLGLGYIFIAGWTLIVIITWLFVRWKIALVLLACFFVAGYSNLRATFALNFNSAFNLSKDPNTLRVMTWNVRYFDDNVRQNDTPNSVRRKMFNYLKDIDADVLLFQDYVDYYSETMSSNLSTVRDSLGYRYCYTTKDAGGHNSYGDSETGVGIFSKLPILDSGKVMYDFGSESVGFVDIQFKNKTTRIFTTHLLSTGIHPRLEYNAGYRAYDSVLSYGKSVIERLQYYDQVHAKQAELVKEVVSKSPYPVIVTGDFNSVPSSYVYHTIKGNLKDAFVRKGFGLGHTYQGLSKTLRIDYLLVDPKFKIIQVKSPRLNLSDHFPVIADLRLK